ncbi:zinc finger, FYVE/PHD-type [Artemisia annua]|uniref:Zinc finger, FYVE/PHD-type n=1 Tax=Artemisia annua TaxID=35608 RepID=A0A2U1PCG9_ARTAN|nr:zinc finger, FYVE/PHD-type [Artemisia annua]
MVVEQFIYASILSLKLMLAKPLGKKNYSNWSLKKTKPKKSEKEPQLHKAIFKAGGLPDGTEVFYITPERNFPGRKQGFGIFCLHCKEEISPSLFEAHAGMASRKKPYKIFTSKVECLSMSGDVLCARCHRLVHTEYLSKTGTSKEVLCQSCTKKHVGPNSTKKIASGAFACLLCRAYDFVEGRLLHDRTSIICYQCEKEYHIGCLNKQKETKLEELPQGKWYCTRVCEEIHYQLRLLMKSEPEKVPDYLLDLINKKLKEGDADDIKNRDVRFVLIRGKKVKEAFETKRLLLGDTIKIFQEQFKPIIDKETRRNFIIRMAHGSHIGERVFFEGVYTAMLTVDSKVVTAGMFRVFGDATAELSIVATSEPYKQKGYFNVLFSCIEKLLSYLCIKKIVLPASVGAKTMWIEKFGFKNMTTGQMEEYRKTQPSMLAFGGTSLLEKGVPIGQRTFRNLRTFKLKLDLK